MSQRKEPTAKELNIAISRWLGVRRDYANDLNAIHTAENGLTGDQVQQYYEKALPEETGSGMWSITCQQKRADVSANSRQRASALLRVVKPEVTGAHAAGRANFL